MVGARLPVCRPRWHSAGGRGLACLVFLASVGIVAYRAFDHVTPLKQTNGTFADFRDASYYPVRAVVDGVDPYDTPRYVPRYPVAQVFPVYAPDYLLLYYPFQLLSLSAARAVHLALTVVLILLMAWLVLRWTGPPPSAAVVLLVAAAIVVSVPGRLALETGQSTMVTVLGFCLAWRFADVRPNVSASGVVLALLKPVVGLPVVLFLLVRRQVRAATLGLAATAVLAGAVTVRLITLPGGLGRFISAVKDNVMTTDQDPAINPKTTWLRVDLVALIGRVFRWDPPMVVQVAVAAAVFALVFAILRTRSTPAGVALLAAVLGVLLAAYAPSYHLLLLAWPLVALARGSDGWHEAGASIRRGLVVLLLVPIVNPFTTQAMASRYANVEWLRLLAPSLDTICLAAAFAVCLVRALRPASGARLAAHADQAVVTPQAHG